MIVLGTDRIAYFDVDSTLALWGCDEKDGPFYYPNEVIINELKQHKLRNHTVVVWSAGGLDWAKRIVKEFKLEEYVDLVICKPSWIWDDLPASKWLPESIRFWKK